MKVLYNKKYEKNAPVDEPPEQDKKEIQENNNISLLIFPICILIQNIIKLF